MLFQLKVPDEMFVFFFFLYLCINMLGFQVIVEEKFR